MWKGIPDVRQGIDTGLINRMDVANKANKRPILVIKANHNQRREIIVSTFSKYGIFNAI